MALVIRHKQRLCDCGRIALYEIRVKLFRADLDTVIHVPLHLCETCYWLERDLERGLGNRPSARRL